ncbi:helix-hairpin-helix domain-containing protein [Halobaculum sp. WSA2]|uniref:Helix-hairpin-helix domain-containing protein n=1 Tax=Halobaculum saliterrae TaxID=2073113 RepID=A0A6B0STD6_9EURY|nr:helix-hairpin-helix domain-containing protein [Halobaculum saliterrae]MXR40846.1 helix-hairpin-helix domain-containing protein [Halobaculum saliterrae]
MGPATAAVLADASFGAADVRDKAVSYRMLVDAGVNPGVAARIRREHSLAWSFESEGDDLARRSSQIRGLGDAERAWVAASSGDWQADDADRPDGDEERDGADRDGSDGTGDEVAEEGGDDAAAERAWVAASAGGDTSGTKTDGSGDPVAAESAWRERSPPTPVGDVEGVSEEDAADLAEAGITSARTLAVADPEEIAEALGRDAARVAELRDAADEHVD